MWFEYSIFVESYYYREFNSTIIDTIFHLNPFLQFLYSKKVILNLIKCI